TLMRPLGTDGSGRARSYTRPQSDVPIAWADGPGGDREDDRQGQERRDPGSRPRLRRAKAQANRAPDRRPDRRDRGALERAPPEPRRFPFRRGRALDRRPPAPQPGDRLELPGGARRRRRQGRTPGGRLQGEATPPQPARRGEADPPPAGRWLGGPAA